MVRTHGRVALAAASFALLFALVTPVPTAAQTADEQALDQARARIAQVEAELEHARTDADSAQLALAEAEAQIARLEEAVNATAQALARQESAVEDATARLARMEAAAGRLRDAFAVRAVDLYKRGAGVPFEAMLSAGSIGDALDRSSYVQAINSSDSASLESLEASRIAVSAERDRVDEEHAALERMRVEQEQILADVQRLREDRALALASVQAEVEELEAQREDLEEESAEIEQLILAREAARPVVPVEVVAAPPVEEDDASSEQAPITPPAVVASVDYIWPRCDQVTSGFGWRWGRMHEGLDINGDTGDPIFAAKAGVVISASYSGVYGNLTLIDHGDGVVTAYAHQSEFLVGSGNAVEQGQQIGTVGTTGSVTGSHLHFETRVHGEAVDPLRFLSSSC